MPLVLVDSSVWIAYYQPRGSEDLKAAVKELIERDEVAINGIIAVEVLRGTTSEEDYLRVLSDMEAFNELPLDWSAFRRSSKLGFDLRRRGIAVPTTDIVIAATALESGCSLWHRDNHFDLIAEHTGLKVENWLKR